MPTKTSSTQSQGHFLETSREVVGTITQEAKRQAGAGWSDFWSQMGVDLRGASPSADKMQIGAEQTPTPKKNAGEIFSLSKHGKTEKAHDQKKTFKPEARPRAEAAINYHADIVKNRERHGQKEKHEKNQTMHELIAELKRLASSSKVLQMEFAQLTVEQAPTEVGEYHVNFLEWMLLVVRAAREKVEDSGAWLATVKNKNGKKGYWGMFKKHGTTFGLSNERVVATQTG